MFASVLISYEVKSLDKTFTYKISNNLDIKIGMKVRVPFGNKLINGFVIDIVDNYDGNYEIKEINGRKEIVIGDAIFTPIDFDNMDLETLRNKIRDDFQQQFVSNQGNINIRHALIRTVSNHIGV